MIIHSSMFRSPANAAAPAKTEADSPAPSPPPDGVVHLKISGMHCAACVARVEEALAAVPGVASASVNLATHRAQVRLAGPVQGERLAAAVRGAGYDARTALSPI